MKLKRSIVRAVAGALAVAVLPAYAATYDLGVLDATVPTTAAHPITGANPADTIAFTIPSLSDNLATQLVNFGTSPVFPSGNYDFSSLTAKFYKVGDVTPLYTIDGLANPSAQGFTVTSGARYYASVTGTPTGDLGGFYQLTLFPHATPAPGPAAVLVFGAGAAALAMRKRFGRKAAAA